MRALIFSRSGRLNWARVIVVLVALMGIGLLISGRETLYGQAPDQRIPNMIGVWNGEFDGCFFDDVRSTGYGPRCFQNTPGEPFRITHQTGRVFAGRAGHPEFPHAEGRFTGVVLPDGSVSIQSFEQSELRMFVTGTLTIRGGRYELVGRGHVFDDLTEKTPEQSGNMATFIGRFTKVE